MNPADRSEHFSTGAATAQKVGAGIRLSRSSLTDYRLEEVLEIHAKLLKIRHASSLAKLLNFIRNQQPLSNMPKAVRVNDLFRERMDGSKAERTRDIILILVQHCSTARSYRIPEEKEIRDLFAATKVKPAGVEIATIQRMIADAKNPGRQAG